MNIRSICRIFLYVILVFFVLNQLHYALAYNQQDTNVDIVIIQYSECPDCVKKYQDYVKPFYDEFRYTYDFEIIDAASSPDYFFEKMDELGIDIASYGNFPWVIFITNSKVIVLDASSLGKVRSTFIDLIGGEPITTTDVNPVPTTTESLNLDILPLTFFLFVLALATFSVTMFTIKVLTEKRFSSSMQLYRIEKNQLLTILTISFISTLTLLYQLIDYYSGGCGCASENLAKTLLFRKYDHIVIGPLDIPVALLGIGLTLSIVFQTFLIGTLPIPLEIGTLKGRKITLTNRHLCYWYYLLCGEMVLAFMSLFVLLYIELVLVKFICVFCTISQVVIVINTVLILSWRPFAK
ncbi:MAG: hypothetical protein ACTSW1_16580 [Candidatus Hodarchaeales archaeon]